MDVRATLQNFALIELMIQILQIDLFGLGKVLTPMDPIEYGYQKPLLFYLMQVLALAWCESVGALMVDAYRADAFGCMTFKESLVGGPPWFENLEIIPNGFGDYL